MKSTKKLSILCALASLFWGHLTYGQKMVILSVNSSTGAVSFSAPGSEVENPNGTEDFTIVIDVNDQIEWEGVSTSGEVVNIDEIDIEADNGKPDSEKIFKKTKINNGKKKIKARVKNSKKENAKGKTYKYKISYILGSNDPIEIDPVIKVKN
ncbi:MAG: hypothetical protein WBN18_05290 [Flavobacteriaceae bacterium]